MEERKIGACGRGTMFKRAADKGGFEWMVEECPKCGAFSLEFLDSPRESMWRVAYLLGADPEQLEEISRKL
jgi:hypothetical protein